MLEEPSISVKSRCCIGVAPLHDEDDDNELLAARHGTAKIERAVLTTSRTSSSSSSSSSSSFKNLFVILISFSFLTRSYVTCVVLNTRPEAQQQRKSIPIFTEPFELQSSKIQVVTRRWPQHQLLATTQTQTHKYINLD